MGDKPIIFSAPMVQALLAGRKSQTRRLVLFPSWACGLFSDPLKLDVETGDDAGHDPEVICEDTGCLSSLPLPYAAGDRLWVRENFSGLYEYDVEKWPPRAWFPNDPIWYWADGNPDDGVWTKPKPSIYMPKWASRLTLVVTDVRVQRLQDINEEDAIAEGVKGDQAENVRKWGYEQHARMAFADLWDGLHGHGSWDENPWVAAISFETHRVNIDALPHPTIVIPNPGAIGREG